MKTYKVIKEFNNAKKGDIFEEAKDMYSDETVYTMNSIEEANSDGFYMKSQVSMELDQNTIESLIKDGFLIEIVNTCDSDSSDKLEEIKDYIDNLLLTYEEDHKTMLEAFENGDVQPCVKVEAETVYHNLIKVLKSIKGKINE